MHLPPPFLRRCLCQGALPCPQVRMPACPVLPEKELFLWTLAQAPLPPGSLPCCAHPFLCSILCVSPSLTGLLTEP